MVSLPIDTSRPHIRGREIGVYVDRAVERGGRLNGRRADIDVKVWFVRKGDTMQSSTLCDYTATGSMEVSALRLTERC